MTVELKTPPPPPPPPVPDTEVVVTMTLAEASHLRTIAYTAMSQASADKTRAFAASLRQRLIDVGVNSY